MNKLKAKARSARNRTAEGASLSVPHSALPPGDQASVIAVNEGYIGPQPGTASRDFATLSERPPAVEPPTSLQSSVDAEKPVPVPRSDARHRQPSSSPQPPKRARSSSAPNPPPPALQQSRPVALRQSSIGIRRTPASLAPTSVTASPNSAANVLQRNASRLPALKEDCHTSTIKSSAPPGRLTQVRSATQTKIPFWKHKKEDSDVEAAAVPGVDGTPPTPAPPAMDYSSNMVDVLDTLDAEVQTLTSLTNIQNSLFVPDLGRFVNRRPTYSFARSPFESLGLEDINRLVGPTKEAQQENTASPSLTRSPTEATMMTLATIDSRLSDSRFAVLPHGASLEGWSKDDKQELNDHVRHMLHSKHSKMKRAMKGFGQYVRRPLGFLVTLYATLITLFGLAWVLFLIGWIDIGGKQIYVIHIIDSVLVALFAIVGDGLAPFRAIDTYHMIFIAYYHHYTWSRRKKDRLPELHDHNDLPVSNAPISERNESNPADPEKQWEFTVLTSRQQTKLEHHQAKFCKSHSFYKPHETETHYAFPLRLLIAIVVLLDCHSLLQISLGATTWGIYYKRRHMAITTAILACSITCNATAGLLILIGDRRTRKKDVLERMNRQELTEEAINHLEKKKERESESERRRRK